MTNDFLLLPSTTTFFFSPLLQLKFFYFDPQHAHFKAPCLQCGSNFVTNPSMVPTKHPPLLHHSIAQTHILFHGCFPSCYNIAPPFEVLTLFSLVVGPLDEEWLKEKHFNPSFFFKHKTWNTRWICV